MHELGILIEVVKTVENFAKRNNVTKIAALVLQIGELAPVIPRYIEECYPAAVDGTMLHDTRLEIEIMPGNGICRHCSRVFNILENNKMCPNCGE